MRRLEGKVDNMEGEEEAATKNTKEEMTAGVYIFYIKNHIPFPLLDIIFSPLSGKI